MFHENLKIMNSIENAIKLIKNAAAIKSPRFVAINGYENSKGEISNYLLNLGVNYQTSKLKDLESLTNINVQEFKSNLPENLRPFKDLVDTAKTELVESLTKNISKDLNDHTNQSKAQILAYVNICQNIKIHPESGQIFITGNVEKKTVLLAGEPYKQVNSKPKTIIKKLMQKGDRRSKYREFKFAQIAEVKISGDTITLML